MRIIKPELKKNIVKYKYIYLMLVPGFLFLFIFKYIPMYGIQLAFKDYIVSQGITGSPWVGLEKFEFLMLEAEFWNAFKNTLIIASMRIILAFPIPIILAILINEMKSGKYMGKYKRILQTVYTFPHFISWVIVSGILFNLFASDGTINHMLGYFNMEQSVLTSKTWFRYLIVYSGTWKEAGWGTIIYLAAIAGINPALYEAAVIDGANRWQKIRYITWPGIQNIVFILLIMRIGKMMTQGFLQILNLFNPIVYEVADILPTYVFRITFLRTPDLGLSTAVGLFNGVTNLILLLTANYLAKKLGKQGLF